MSTLPAFKLIILDSFHSHLVDINCFHYFRHLPEEEINHTLKHLCLSIGSAGEQHNLLRCMHPKLGKMTPLYGLLMNSAMFSPLKHIVLNSRGSPMSFFTKGTACPPVLITFKTMCWSFTPGRKASTGLILPFPIPSGHLLNHHSDSLQCYSSSIFCHGVT